MPKLTAIFFTIICCTSCTYTSLNIKPEKYTNSNNQCEYTTLKSQEFRTTKSFNESAYLYAKMNKNSCSSSDEYSPYDQTKNRENYSSLLNQKFRVLETNVKTGSECTFNRKKENTEFSSNNQKLLSNTIFEYRHCGSIKIITEDCSIYYISPEIDPQNIGYYFRRGDGSKLTDDDYFHLLGKNSLRPATIEAKIDFDKFKKTYKISTPLILDHLLIRGTIPSDSKNFSFIQLYVILNFGPDWGYIDTAYDIEGQKHAVTNISSDANCEILPCTHIETLGIDITLDYLYKHIEGFSIKVYGKQQLEFSVPSTLIISFIDGYKKALANMPK